MKYDVTKLQPQAARSTLHKAERKPRGICQSNTAKVPAHINSFIPESKQSNNSGHKMVDGRLDSEQQTLMKSGHGGDGAGGHLLHSQLRPAVIFLLKESRYSQNHSPCEERTQHFAGSRGNCLVVGNFHAAAQLQQGALPLYEQLSCAIHGEEPPQTKCHL